MVPDEGKLLAWHFVPLERIAERVERDPVPYDRWAADGWIITPPGRATDKLAIAKVLAEVRQAYGVQAVAHDRWRMEELLKLLGDEGIDLPLEPFGQGFVTMGPAVDAFETALLSGLLRHNGNPVQNWEAGDVVVDTDPAGNRKAIKGRSFDKIHGIVAAIMACGLAQKHEQAPEPWFCDLPPRPWARNLQAEFARTVLPADWSWSWTFQAFSRAIPRPVGRRTRSRWMPAFWTRTRCARLKGTIQGRSCQ